MSNPKQIYTTAKGHETLKALKHNIEDEHSGPFKEMGDAYKFCVAFGLRCGKISSEVGSTSIFHFSQLDPERNLHDTVALLRPAECVNEPVYRSVMRLANAGLEELVERTAGGTIRFQQIIEELEAEED